MKITFFSDTHTEHNMVIIPNTDILVFTGDCSGRGSRQDTIDFLNWFSKQPSKHKVMIAGNHDFFFEVQRQEVINIMPDNIHYLEDSSITIEGIKFYGSPVTPYFHNWAFNKYRNTTKSGEYSPDLYKGIKEHWDEIPNDTDIMLSHGPSADALDLLCEKFRKPNEHPNVGCMDLSIALKRVKPKILAFGHIHETYGTQQVEDILHINSSVMNENYECINKPISIEYTNQIEHIYN